MMYGVPSPRDHSFLAPAPGTPHPECCALCGCLAGTHTYVPAARSSGEAPPDAASGGREERARLVRIANSLGAGTALAACGFVRCPERHSGTDERCLLGRGHVRDDGYSSHQSESVSWITRQVVAAEAPPSEPSAASGETDWMKATLADYDRLAAALHERGIHEWADTVTAILAMLPPIDAGSGLEVKEYARLCEELAEAAREINCSGPIPHRIRVLKREHAEQLALIQQHTAALTQENERLRAEVKCEDCKEYRLTVSRRIPSHDFVPWPGEGCGYKRACGRTDPGPHKGE